MKRVRSEELEVRSWKCTMQNAEWKMHNAQCTMRTLSGDGEAIRIPLGMHSSVEKRPVPSSPHPAGMRRASLRDAKNLTLRSLLPSYTSLTGCPCLRHGGINGGTSDGISGGINGGVNKGATP